MKIALDFDNTISLDLLFWSDFIKMAKRYGHMVTVVTMRNQHDENSDIEGFAYDNSVRVVYSNMKQKNEVYSADIWIDDMPLTIPTIDAMKALTILS